MNTLSEQEFFWVGSFGDEYTERNKVSAEARLPFFRTVLDLAPGVQEVCELGANRGHNLEALRTLNGTLELTGVEPNPSAFEELSKQPGLEPIQSSIQGYAATRRFDLVFTSCVLIHVNPDDLANVYRKIAELSRKYVLLNEYFNPVPVEIAYRGHRGKLFKRDFGGEFLDTMGGEFEVVRYGFLWKRLEPAWDDTTWVLFRRVPK